LSFIEPGRRWDDIPSPVKLLVFLTRVLRNLHEDVKNLRRSLAVIWCFFMFPRVLMLGA